jgi:enoyl-[acyl-carrier protein] reductase III
MYDLTGQVALVTGSARGIGRATALRLAEVGADLVVNYVSSQSAALETAEQIQQLGRRSAVVKADVSETDDVRAMIEFVRERFGRLDILVSNAAGGGFRSLADANARNFETAMNTNCRALLDLVQAALPLLARPTGRAKVIALSSHGSTRALPHYGLIGASKAALESLVRHMALEFGASGINFNIVQAGLVETDATRHVPGAAEMFASAVSESLVGNRRLLPADVAEAVLFLASPASDLVQGHTLVIDGGQSLRV